MSKYIVIRLAACLSLVGCSNQSLSGDIGYREDQLVTGTNWLSRMSGSPGTHLISLPPNLDSYGNAWVYQFGDNFSSWPTGNMECGPASIQMIERLSGRDSADCTYHASVPGCDDYPSVRTNCRAVSVCGEEAFLPGSSFRGTGTFAVAGALNALGYATRAYHRSTTPVSLSIVKNAILQNHPIIVALSPMTYSSETGYARPTRNSTTGALYGVDSHWVVVIGFGNECDNVAYGPDYHGPPASGFVYMMDPGWRNGRLTCISEEMFNRALDEEYHPSTYSAVEITRPGYEAFPNASWYPPGTLLRVEGEYYYVLQPADVTGAPRVRHASPAALATNRVPADRAISASRDALACMDSLGEMDASRRFREYREASSGAIYLVDVVDRTRRAFLNYDAYLSYNGRDEWRTATPAEIATWSRYSRGEVGLSPGTLVVSDAPGVTSVWVVSVNASGRLRLPIFNERAARVYGYDISSFRPGAFVRVHHADLDRLAGPEGQVLTEEMAGDCHARRCLAAVGCFSAVPSSIGGGGDSMGIGNGACTAADCSTELPLDDSSVPTPPDAGVSPTPGCSVDTDCPAYGSGWRCRSGTCRETDIDGDGYLGSEGDCNIDVARIHRDAVESCDYVDEDCDGRVDETFDLTSDPRNCGSCGRACGSGEVCSAGTCLTPCSASSEVCGDGIDNNCDGRVDEGCAPVCTPVAEVCDGRDQDCDGRIDEGIAPIACSTACGSGTQACVGGSFGICSARTPSAETCNGLDDDCDGTVDEGVCAPACVPTSPSRDICDGRDNDCDGTVDNRCPAMSPYLVEIWMDPSMLDDCPDPGGFRINLWGSGGIVLQNAVSEPFRRTIDASWLAASAVTLSCSVAPTWHDWTGHVGEPSSLNGALVMRLGGRDMLPTSLVCNDMVNPSWGAKPYLPLESRYEGSCTPRW